MSLPRRAADASTAPNRFSCTSEYAHQHQPNKENYSVPAFVDASGVIHVQRKGFQYFEALLPVQDAQE